MEEYTQAEQLQHIQNTRQEAEKLINNAASLARLRKNKDFKKIIEEGYFKELASNLVLAKGNPSIKHNEQAVKDIEDAINAIGDFNQHLTIIMAQGEAAKNQLLDCNEEEQQVLNNYSTNNDSEVS